MSQIGTIKVRKSGSTVTVPVYQTSDFSSGPYVKVYTGSETGGVNLVDPGDSSATKVRIWDGSAVKAFSSSGPGGQVTVDATLNSQTAEITVYEDTTGDGTPDNIETKTISDGNNSYNLSNISGGAGNDYWVEVSLTNSDSSNSAEINYIELAV